MSQNTCSNPECKKIYDVNEKDDSMGCCSFECWEKVNCKAPAEIQFEKLEII